MTAMNELTSAEIQARLTKLQEAEEAHRARDFDGELAAALSQGGDVDELETQHLEAERQARRHRVERTALEAALPAALGREGLAQVAVLRAEYDELRPEAIKARDKALRAAASLEVALKEWAGISTAGTHLGQQAYSAARAAGIKSDSFGTFISSDIAGLPERLIPLMNELSMKEAQRTGQAESLD